MSTRMSSFIRALGFLSGGVVTTFAAMILVLWAGFDGRKLRTDLVEHVRTHYQRTLRLDGPVRLSIWPRPALVTGRMSLSEPGREDVFAAVQSARFPIALWPPLGDQHSIVGANLEGLELRLRRQAAGDWNFKDLLDTTDAPLGWGLERVRVARGRIVLRDDASKRQIEFGDLRLLTDSLLPGTGGRINASGQVFEEGSATQAQLQISAGYQIGAALSEARSTAVSLRITGQVLGLEGAEGLLSLDSLAWQAQGDTGDLANARGSLRGALGTRSADFRMALPKLSWSTAGPTLERLEGTLALRAAREDSQYTVKLARLAPWVSTGGGLLRGEPLQLEWRSRVADIGNQGRLQAPLTIEYQQGRARLAPLSGELMLIHPALNQANARAELGGEAYWNYDAALAAPPPAKGSKTAVAVPAAGGQLEARFGEDRIALQTQFASLSPLIGSFSLDSARLDMDRLLAGTAARASGTTAPAAAQTDAAAWLPAKGSVLDGKLRLRELRLRGLRIDELQSTAKLADSRLELGPHTVSLYGGQLAGNAVVQPDGKLQWRAAAKDVQLAPLLADGDGAFPLEGLLSLQADLSAAAGDWSQPAGNLRFSLKEAAWRGVDMAQSLREFRDDVKEKRDAARTPLVGERTVLMQAQGVVNLQGGRGKLQGFSASNPWLNLSGGGELSPADDTLDLNLRASIGSPGPRSSAHDLGELRGKVLPLQLKGRIEQPDVRLTLSTPPARVVTRPASVGSAPVVARPAPPVAAPAVEAKP
ncbi:MAG: AsmA family protein [Moraxellaceae bacterium]|nr:AsmA family protein [Moraxellaceae bacterium]